MEDGKGCIRFKIELFGVTFVGRVVNVRKLWEVMVVVSMRLGGMAVAFNVGCGMFGIIWIVWSISVWKDAKRWLKFSVITKLFSLSCSVTSSLKDGLSSFLKVALLVSIILRKSSLEKLDTIVDSSLDIDAVVFVVVD